MDEYRGKLNDRERRIAYFMLTFLFPVSCRHIVILRRSACRTSKDIRRQVTKSNTFFIASHPSDSRYLAKVILPELVIFAVPSKVCVRLYSTSCLREGFQFILEMGEIHIFPYFQATSEKNSHFGNRIMKCHTRTS